MKTSITDLCVCAGFEYVAFPDPTPCTYISIEEIQNIVGRGTVTPYILEYIQLREFQGYSHKNAIESIREAYNGKNKTFSKTK